MNRNVVLIGMVAMVVFLGLGDVAFAESEGYGDTKAWSGKIGQVVSVTLKVLMGIFVMLAIGLLMMGLWDSKKFGFSYFAMSLIAVIVCGLAIHIIQDMAGIDANENLKAIKVQRGK